MCIFIEFLDYVLLGLRMVLKSSQYVLPSVDVELAEDRPPLSHFLLLSAWVEYVRSKLCKLLDFLFRSIEIYVGL